MAFGFYLAECSSSKEKSPKKKVLFAKCQLVTHFPGVAYCFAAADTTTTVAAAAAASKINAEKCILCTHQNDKCNEI